MRRITTRWRLFLLVQLVLLAVWQPPEAAAGKPVPIVPPAGYTAARRTFGPLRSAPQAPPAGLISEWDAEGTANDSVGTNNGSFDGTYTPSQPGLGQAFLLNGSGQSVTIPDSPSLHPTTISVAAWVRVDAFTNGTAPPGQDYIVFKQNSRPIQFEGYVLGMANDHFSFSIASASGQQVGAGSATAITLGQWYHLVGTYDGTAVKLSVNGNLEASAPASFPLDIGSNPLYFGQTGYAPFNGYLQGALDHAQLYNRALTAAEVQQVYQTGLTAPLPGDVPTSQIIPLKVVQSGGDPVSTLTGAFSYRHSDLAIAGRGPSPAFTRSYNSGDGRNGPLGPGWTDSYAIRLTTPPGATGNLTLVGPDGHSDTFTLSNGSYLPPPGVATQLVRNGDGTYTVTQKDQSAWHFDAIGQLTAIVDRYGNASALTYNASGQLASASDPAGRGSLTLAYDPGSGRLVSVTDWANPPRVVRYAYDASNRLQTVTDRAGHATTYGYDGTSSRLASITDANLHVALTLGYDSLGRVHSQQDALGLSTGQLTSFGYATSNATGPQTTTVTLPAADFDGFHPTTVDTYNALGQLSQRQSTPSATDGTSTESFSYDGNDNLISHTDPRGATTSYCYDVGYDGQPSGAGRGNLTRVIAPPPQSGQNPVVTLLQYDTTSGAGTSGNVNNLTETVSPNGVANGASVSCSTNLSGSLNLLSATDSAYDAKKVFLQTVTQRSTDPDLGPQTAVTQYQYADAANPGRVTAVIPPLGTAHATTMAYFASGSEAGLLQSATDGDGNKTTYQYDAVGRRTSMVDPNGNAPGGVASQHTWTWTDDNEDRLLTASAPAPQAGGSPLTTQDQYDAVGNRTVLIDPSGQVTTSRYDARDSLIETDQSPLAWTVPNQPPSTVYATTASYDNLGNLARVTRAKGDAANERATDYTYDGLNRLRQETQYPAWPAVTPTLVTQYHYDGNSNLTGRTDPLGQTTTDGYDALNRLTSVTYSDGKTPNVSYQYNADGNRTSMADGTGTTRYTVDELGRPTTIAAPAGAVGYRYDLDGNRAKTLYPDGTAVTAAYDNADRPLTLTDWATRTTRSGSFPDGSLQTVTHPNGVVTTYSEDHAQRLTQVSNALGTSILGQQTYSLDPLGNRTQVSELLPQLTTVGGLAPSTAPTGGTARTSTARPGPSLLPALGSPLPPLPQKGVRPVPPAVQPAPRLPLPALPLPPARSAALTAPLASPTSPNAGAPWLWGDDYAGQLGDGATTNRSTPQAVAGQTGVSAAAGGGAFSLVLHPDGTVWAMGDNSTGELGNGTTTSSTTPVQVTGLTGVAAIAAGALHGVALKQDGTVWAWGDNTDGELGNGTTVSSSSPVQVTGLSGITAVASNGYHTLALRGDGTVWAWGLNAEGQLGQGTTSSTGCSCSATPVQVAGVAGASAVAAGFDHSAALVGGGVWSWGYNADGELGQGTTTTTGCSCNPTPGQVTGAGGTGTLTGVTALAAGSFHTLALVSGAPWGWGANGSGQLGDGTSTNRPSPVQVSGLTAVTRFAGGYAHSLAHTSAGQVFAFGDNSYGELGTGDRTSHLVPVVVAALSGPAALAGGGAQSLAIASGGQLLSWGDDYWGQLGDGATTNRSSPQQLVGRTGVVQAAGGNGFSAMLGGDGTVWTQGDNSVGELGDGTTTQRTSPVQVPGLTAVQQVATGGGQTLALQQDGTVWAWGDNAYGELGDGTTTDRSSPVQVAGLANVVAVAAGYADSYALKQDGSVWAWGYNADGELGDGTTTTTGCQCSMAPVQVVGPGGTGTLGGVTSLAAGGFAGLAVKGDGTLWSWGYNGTGALGDGTTTSRSSPVQVAGLAGVTGAAGGFLFSLAVKADGTVWGWGDNSQGQLGDGTIAPRLVPVQAVGIAGAVGAAGGADHTLALTGAGALWAMGSNSYGQLGTGDRTQQVTPVQVPGPGGMATLAAGATHSLATALRSRTTNYTYDHLSELTGAAGPGQQPAAYAYDPAGNRTSARQGSTTTAFAQDKADRLTAAGPYTATSDGDGNLTALSGNGLSESFAYDQANRLTSATVNGATTTYAYDGDGNRVSQTVNGATTAYVNDTNRALPVILTEGPTKDVWGPGGLAERVDATGNVQVPLTDGLGSVRALTDGTGNVIQTYLTDAFGNPANLPGSQGAASQPFGYTGQPADPLGLVDLRARVYAPALGRFLQRDPLAGNLADPLSVNRSTYARNNPTTLTDPSGLTPTNRVLSVVLGASSESDANCEASDPLCDTSTQITVSGENSSDAGGGAGLGAGSANFGSGESGGSGPWPGPRGGRQTIGGLEYSAHALDRMAPRGLTLVGKEIFSRGIPPSVVANAVRHGTRLAAGTVGVVRVTYENVVVVLNEVENRVITVINTDH